MKKLISVSTAFLLFVGTLLLPHSCVRPDLSDCPQQSVRIVVRTLAEMSRSEGDTYDIENVTVYVFDDQNRFIMALEGEHYVSDPVFAANLELEPGTYNFVVWTNRGDTYKSTHSIAECDQKFPSMGELMRYMNCPSSKVLTETIQDLHHGMLTNAVVAVNTNHEFTVVIAPNTYRVNFSVQELNECTDDYSFSLSDDNSHYTYSNAIVAGKDSFEHLRTAKFVDGKLNASIKTLRLRENRTVPFVFTNLTTGKNLYSADLVDMIKRAYTTWGQTVDFDNTFEFDVVISFRGALGISIKVNGWEYVENDTEL